MDFELLGGAAAEPTLSLDHEEFAYAGKFVMSSTGKSVVRHEGEIVGAVAFSQDRSDAQTVRLRYVTVREDHRGQGTGPRLLRFTAEAVQDSFDDVVIAANNPIAYEACYRAGFVYTGEQTGIAELLLRYDTDCQRDDAVYQGGLAVYGERDLPPEHQAIIERYLGTEPPPIVPAPECTE